MHNILFASLFTGVYDVNRNEMLQENDFSLVQTWYNSVVSKKIKAVIFHNCFSPELVDTYTNEFVRFEQVDYDARLKPNVFRYFVYRDYLQAHAAEIANVFVTDISDVELIQNPFDQPLFTAHLDALFCGDEPAILDNPWMHDHCSHIRNLMPTFAAYEEANKQCPLLNCGIIGGSMQTMQALFDEMVAMHTNYSFSNQTAYTLDMGVFNYVARTTFADRLVHGEPVNTVFKQFETARSDCWFRHK